MSSHVEPRPADSLVQALGRTPAGHWAVARGATVPVGPAPATGSRWMAAPTGVRPGCTTTPALDVRADRASTADPEGSDRPQPAGPDGAGPQPDGFRTGGPPAGWPSPGGPPSGGPPPGSPPPDGPPPGSPPSGSPPSGGGEAGRLQADGPDPGGPGDSWALVRAVQDGDAQAYGTLYDRYVELVYRYAYHRLGDRALAEDVTSETFLRALRRIGSLSYLGRDVGAWFVTIARNLVLDHVKSGRYRFEVATADMRDADRSTDGPETTVLDHLTNEALLHCVRRLNPEQQECIVLRFLQGRSVAETAEVMSRTEGAVKALQHRAVRRLADLLPEGVR